MWKRVSTLIAFSVVVSMFSGCAYQDVASPFSVNIIQKTGSNCQYAIAPYQVQTLQSLREMRGSLGQVVQTGELLSSDSPILASGEGFKGVDMQYVQSGGTIVPLTYGSLFIVSVYAALEKMHLFLKDLDPSYGDVTRLVVHPEDTRILYRARYLSSTTNSEYVDNASYLPYKVSGMIRNYFFTYPTSQIHDLPLGLNVEVLGHEFVHYYSQWRYLGTAKRTYTDDESYNTMSSLDEGMADYFAFNTTADPKFLLCSLPNANRDLSVPKQFTTTLKTRIQSDSDFSSMHSGGAVWASMQYQIGEAIGKSLRSSAAGHKTNARALMQMMVGFSNCASGGKMTFPSIARCHLNYLGTYSSQARSIYNAMLGAYGGI